MSDCKCSRCYVRNHPFWDDKELLDSIGDLILHVNKKGYRLSIVSLLRFIIEQSEEIEYDT